MADCIFSTLQVGSAGPEQTKVLQKRLALVQDGIYGQVTKSAVMSYQKSTPGLAVDGICGQVTGTSLGIWCNGGGGGRTVGPVQKTIEDGTGLQFDSFTEFYNIVKEKCAYAYYFDDQKSVSSEESMLIADINGAAAGMNCVDYTQIGVKLAKEMGYTATPYGIWCQQDQINHAIFLISGKEFKSSTWVDLSAAANNSYSIGNHWCSGATTKNPSWIPTE